VCSYEACIVLHIVLIVKVVVNEFDTYMLKDVHVYLDVYVCTLGYVGEFSVHSL
jgi:hypothetical protein